MRELSETVGPLAAANAAIIAASQAGTANTALTLTTSPYTLDTFRRIIITSAGDDHTKTFKIVGLNSSGMSVTETLAGATAGNAAQSLYDYSVITSITPSANTAGNVQVGTNGVASTRPIYLDKWGPAQVALQIDVTGTVNATVQQTLDSLNPTSNFLTANWVNHPDSNLVGLTGTCQGNYAYAPMWVRLVLNSGTGSATLKVLQAGYPR